MIDLKQAIKTTSGLPVKILETDAAGEFPIIGLIRYPNGDDMVVRFNKSGYAVHSDTHTQIMIENIPVETYSYVGYRDSKITSVGTTLNDVYSGEHGKVARITYINGEPVEIKNINLFKPKEKDFDYKPFDEFDKI